MAEKLDFKIAVAVDLPAKNSECPVWNPVDQHLYWADIPNARLYRYNPTSGSYNLVLEREEEIGGLVVCEDGGILLLGEEGHIAKWHHGKVRTLLTKLPDEKNRRFNDAIVDPMGRLIAGMMPADEESVRLYSIQPDGSFRVLLNDVLQSNGMAFSSDGRTLYHTDTKAATITAYAYDPASGERSNVIKTLSLNQPSYKPDGLALDDQGRLWSAQWGGGCVLLLNNDELLELAMPTAKVSSVVFGGQDLSQLFITTAGGEERTEADPLAGSVFMCNVGCRGLPAYLAKF